MSKNFYLEKKSKLHEKMNEFGNQVFSLIGQILFIEILNTSNREKIKYIIEVSVI